MELFRKIADNSEIDSLASRLRRKRFALFMHLLESLPRPIKILDVGGTQGFWELMGFTNEPDVEVVILNVSAMAMLYDNFASIVGDARDMRSFADNAFDVVFSNSVIEHVGTYADQYRMAEEVQRVGKRYFLQTPNRYFPIEPHFLFPLFQFLPLSLRIFLMRRFDLGWFKKIPDKQQATEHVRSIRLLTRRELLALFPGAMLYKEKFLGLTKSLIVYDGWTAASRKGK
jgi:SAM-dependent methyltransferase